MTAADVAAGEVAADVLDRARAGDAAAFTEVVRHYDGRLRALAYRLMDHDRSRMDDAMQDAYVKAFRALPRFRSDAGLGTWLYRITYNACLDVRRHEQRRRSSALDDLTPAAGPPSQDPGAVATIRADLGTTQAVAVASLPPGLSR